MMSDIVVIDDESRYRRLIARVLTAAGHEVREAADGAQGLAMCLERTPQLVITDLVMPGMEGIETILHLSREHPGIKVLAISGAEPASVYLRAATALGASASLAKPFTVERLMAAVEALLAADQTVPAGSD
jgi:DNA-binding NtrC family response regulator